MELIINKVRSILLIPPTEPIPPTDFEIVRTIENLLGKEAYDFLVEQNSTLAKNGLSNHTKRKKRVGT